MLSAKQKKFFRAQAHKLKPVVIIGAAGLTESVLKEIDQSIEHHELIKVRVNAADKTERQSMIDQICDSLGIELIGMIGHVATFFRQAKTPKIKLPKI